MSDPDPSLTRAYSLRSTDDVRRLYSAWANSYDGTFAAAMDYQLPARVAEAYDRAGGSGPVLDIGAGTGLVAERLAELGHGVIDGTDISEEMLAVADAKGLYRRVFHGDVAGRLVVADESYDGVVSAGTFTQGHVGPGALPELLRIARPGAVFALSINAEHYEALAFGPAFRALEAQISDLRLPEVKIYGAAATGPHALDLGRVALFRKA
jgi:predicted TPR repeat methyltransferase